MLIDAIGFSCPKPVIMAGEALSKAEDGIVEILVDNEASAKNLEKFSFKNGFYSEITKNDNYWRVTIVKGFVCEVPVEAKKAEEITEPEKGFIIIIASDTMGNEEELGRILMKAFFETMKVYKELPNTMFFLNTGVKLTTIDEEILPILKEIENM